MYKERPVDLLDVVMGSADFEELLGKLTMMRRLSDADAAHRLHNGCRSRRRAGAALVAAVTRCGPAWPPPTGAGTSWGSADRAPRPAPPKPACCGEAGQAKPSQNRFAQSLRGFSGREPGGRVIKAAASKVDARAQSNHAG
jgi:hypothetical protein